MGRHEALLADVLARGVRRVPRPVERRRRVAHGAGCRPAGAAPAGPAQRAAPVAAPPRARRGRTTRRAARAPRPARRTSGVGQDAGRGHEEDDALDGGDDLAPVAERERDAQPRQHPAGQRVGVAGRPIASTHPPYDGRRARSAPAAGRRRPPRRSGPRRRTRGPGRAGDPAVDRVEHECDHRERRRGAPPGRCAERVRDQRGQRAGEHRAGQRHQVGRARSGPPSRPQAATTATAPAPTPHASPDAPRRGRQLGPTAATAASSPVSATRPPASACRTDHHVLPALTSRSGDASLSRTTRAARARFTRTEALAPDWSGPVPTGWPCANPPTRRPAHRAGRLARRRLPTGPLGPRPRCGTGSMARWLAPRLPGPQRWVLHDRDADLLGRVHEPARAGVRRRRRDPARRRHPAGPGVVADADLLTASALLDMMTAAELERFVDGCVRPGCPCWSRSAVVGRVERASRGAWTPRWRRLQRPPAPDERAATRCSARRRGPAVEVLPARPGVTVRPSPWGLGPDREPWPPRGSPAGWGPPPSSDPGCGATSAPTYDGGLCSSTPAALSVTVHHEDFLARPPERRPGGFAPSRPRRPARPRPAGHARASAGTGTSAATRCCHSWSATTRAAASTTRSRGTSPDSTASTTSWWVVGGVDGHQQQVGPGPESPDGREVLAERGPHPERVGDGDPLEAELVTQVVVDLRSLARRRPGLHRADVEVGHHDRRGARLDGRGERPQVASAQLRQRRAEHRQPQVAVGGHAAVAREVLGGRDQAALLVALHRRADGAGRERRVAGGRAGADVGSALPIVTSATGAKTQVKPGPAARGRWRVRPR